MAARAHPQGAGPAGPLLVGVMSGQHPEVMEQARELAVVTGRPLVFALVLNHVDRSEWNGHRYQDFASLHPDERAEIDSTAITEIRDRVESVMSPATVDWTLRVLLGDPARVLAQVGRELAVSMILIGSHRRMRQLPLSRVLHGSLVARVLSRQDRPVLVIPPAPERAPGGSGLAP